MAVATRIEDAAFEASQAEYDRLMDRVDDVCDAYAAHLRATNLATVSKGIYRVSLTGRERRYGVEYVDISLTPSPAPYQSVKVAEHQGGGVGYIKTDTGELRTWPDVERGDPRVLAVLAAVEVLLGSADPIAYAKAYARESQTCWRCGEPLLVGVSQQLLMGPTCFRTEYGMTQRQGIAAGIGAAPAAAS
jgi:ribosomal protein S14